MRKVFTYSRKRPISSVATSNSTTIGSDKENFAVEIANNLQNDTPQTKRQKDIRSIMTTVDSKLSSLTKKLTTLPDSSNFSQLYKHKEWLLTNSSQQDGDVSIEALLKILQQSQLARFAAWFDSLSEYANHRHIFLLTI